MSRSAGNGANNANACMQMPSDAGSGSDPTFWNYVGTRGDTSSQSRCASTSKRSSTRLSRAGGPTEAETDWMAWARAKADWVDPLVPLSDVVLDAPEPKSPGYFYHWQDDDDSGLPPLPGGVT